MDQIGFSKNRATTGGLISRGNIVPITGYDRHSVRRMNFFLGFERESDNHVNQESIQNHGQLSHGNIAFPSSRRRRISRGLHVYSKYRDRG